MPLAEEAIDLPPNRIAMAAAARKWAHCPKRTGPTKGDDMGVESIGCPRMGRLMRRATRDELMGPHSQGAGQSVDFTEIRHWEQLFAFISAQSDLRQSAFIIGWFSLSHQRS
jgi:hypothetical protein